MAEHLRFVAQVLREKRGLCVLSRIYRNDLGTLLQLVHLFLLVDFSGTKHEQTDFRKQVDGTLHFNVATYPLILSEQAMSNCRFAFTQVVLNRNYR